jgi:hypothetical protein
MHKIIMANDYDTEHLITQAYIYIFPDAIDSEQPYEDEVKPEILHRSQILKQLLDGVPFYVLTSDADGKSCPIQIIVFPYGNGKLYIKPRNDITNYIPSDYLRYTCSIHDWTRENDA